VGVARHRPLDGEDLGGGLAGSATAPHALHTYVDDDVAPPGQVRLRFVSAAFASVAHPSPAATGAAAIDANGYAALATGDVAAGSTLTACLPGLAPGPVTCPISQYLGGPALPALHVGTTFAVGGTPSAAPRFLRCVDDVPAPAGNSSTRR
jgi:hypothetical protein